MRRATILRAVTCLLPVILIAGVFAVMVAGCSSPTEEPAKVIENVTNQANDAARAANIAVINVALQAYQAVNEGATPTNIDQLAKYLEGGRLPVDPYGGTYYLNTATRYRWESASQVIPD
jgi:hypothetical protein